MEYLNTEKAERTLELHFDRRDFEEIYFKDNRASIFLNPQIRTRFLITAISILLSASSITYSLLTNKGVWLIVPLLILFLIAASYYYSNAVVIIKWRKNIKAFLNKTEKIRRRKLILAPNSFSVTEVMLKFLSNGQ